MRAVEGGVTEAILATPVGPDAWSFATGGAYTATGIDPMVVGFPESRVRAFLSWDRSRRAHEAWTASLSCPACGGEAGPLHVCPEPALPLCACGCGASLTGSRSNRRYVKDSHRKRADRRNA